MTKPHFFVAFENNLEPIADTYGDVAEHLFGLARTIFEDEGHHGSIAFLCRKRALVGVQGMSTETPERKRAAQLLLARHAVQLESDCVAWIAESWMAIVAGAYTGQRASQMPNRTEVLTLTMVSKGTESLFLYADISRKESGPALGPTQRQPTGSPLMFQDLFEAWGKPMPGFSGEVEEETDAIHGKTVGGDEPN